MSSTKGITRQAIISKNFRLDTEDEAHYFAWVLSEWFYMHFVDGEPSNSLAYSWYTADHSNTTDWYHWELKCSAHEPYIYKRFDKDIILHTDSHLVLSDIKNKGLMEVYCKAHVHEVVSFAGQLMQLNNIINVGISTGVFKDVAVPIDEQDFADEGLPQFIRQNIIT